MANIHVLMSLAYVLYCSDLCSCSPLLLAPPIVAATQTRTRERVHTLAIVRAQKRSGGGAMGRRGVVAFLDEGDHTGERAPMVELGARAVAAVVVGRLVRREVLTDMPVLPPL